MDLFKLFGTIAINNSDANKKIDETTNKASKTSDYFSKMGSKFSSVGTAIGVVGKKMMPVSLGIAGIGTASVKTAADFEASMSQVAATMGITSEEINNGSKEYKKLEAAAREMGSKTKFSAQESAEALNYLALAGYDTNKAVKTLPTILNLAAAGNIDLASASDMVTDAMSALGAKAGSCESFVDKMAKTSQKSNTSVAQLGEAILTVGGTAKTMSGGVTEMNTCLGILADNGIKGAEGGTALRNIILSLSAPTSKAAKTMKQLGVEVLDANGNMRPMNDIFNDLNGSLSKMSQGEQIKVLSTLFNKVDLKSANALLSNSGKRFDELSGYIDKSKGAAQSMSDTMQNNLNGRLTTLKSALSEAAISIGQKLLPHIKNITSAILNWTDKFNGLNSGQQDMIIKIGLIVAAIGPALIIIGKIITVVGTVIAWIPKIQAAIVAVKTAMIGLNATMLANPVTWIIAGIVGLVAAFVVLWNKCEAFRNFWKKLWEGIKSAASACWEAIKSGFSSLGSAICSVFTTIANVVKVGIMLIGSIISAAVTIITIPFKFIWENCKNIVIKVWNAIKSAVTKAINGVKSVITKVFNAIKSVITTVMNAIKSVITKVWNGIKSVITPIINGIKSVITTVFNGIKNTISNIFNGIKSVASKVWNAIKSAVTTPVNAIKSTVSNVFGAVKDKISSAINGAKDIVSKGLSAIKGFFNKLKLKFPKIKLPHFSLSGSFSLKKMTVPKLSVEWYKKAMNEPYLFTKPTVMGNKGFGDAGDEIVYGKDSLMNDIRNATNNVPIQEKMNEMISLMKQMLEMNITLDSGALVGGLAPAMDTALGNIYQAKGRGGRSRW